MRRRDRGYPPTTADILLEKGIKSGYLREYLASVRKPKWALYVSHEMLRHLGD